MMYNDAQQKSSKKIFFCEFKSIISLVCCTCLTTLATFNSLKLHCNNSQVSLIFRTKPKPIIMMTVTYSLPFKLQLDFIITIIVKIAKM